MPTITSKGLLRTMALVACMVIGCAACGAPTATPNGAAICTAVSGLAGNQADFQTYLKATTQAEAFGAVDRMKSRAQSAINALLAINDTALSKPAHELAAVEQGLLPILDQFRAITDQASYTAARNAYATWYGSSAASITAITSEITRLGVVCG